MRHQPQNQGEAIKERKRSEKEGPASAIELGLRGERKKPGHTTNPPDSCLSRTLSVQNVGKGQRQADEGSAAPPGGRFWHGFAVRRPPVGRGGRGLTFGLHAEQEGPFGDNRGMARKSAAPTFFTERSLASYLAVSDRTIRNWIKRGELPSYKLGAARRIDPADVEDFLARHRDAAA